MKAKHTEFNIRNFYSFFCMLFLVLLFYSCEKEVFVEPANRSKVNYCSAYIDSRPLGAKIYVDGKYAGCVTPDTVRWLSNGSHSVRLQFNSVIDTVFLLNTDTLKPSSVYIDYFSSMERYGAIYCESTPKSAEIFLDDKTVSKFTPDTLKYLLPGQYKIKVHRYGFRDDSSMVNVTGGKTATTGFTLQDTTEWIDYRVCNSTIPSNKIVDIEAGNDNSIWIGTYNDGLSKFTYGRFSNFNTSNSAIPSNFITCLKTDKKGNLWVGTMEGLAYLSGNLWCMEKGLPSDYITSILCRSNGETFIGTSKGLAVLNSSYDYDLIIEEHPFLKNKISSITENIDGNIWIATDEGVACFNAYEWKYYSNDDIGYPGNTPVSVAADIYGNIWCSFPDNSSKRGALVKFDGSEWKEVSLPVYYKGSIHRIVPDERGNLWLCTNNGILMMYPDYSYYIFAGKKYAMATSNGTDITVDKKYKVWFALWEGGIVKCKLKIL